MGAPKGPRLPPEIHTDEAGTFTVYPGKSCSVCSIALTSRTRHGTSRLCISHGREKDASRHRSQGQPPSQRTTRTMPTPTTPCDSPRIPRADFQSPQYRRLQSLFTAFINHPTLDDSSALLVSAMNDYELIARLRRVIPD